MAPKKAPSIVAVVEAPPAEAAEAPQPPPPRDPKVPLTFDEMWFNADDEIEDDEEKHHAKELKALIMVKATEVRQYLEESLMVAIILQSLQHMIVDRPNDPFRYLARFIQDKGPNIAAEIEHAKKIAARKQAARDKAKLDALDSDRLVGEAAEAAAKALRNREVAKLAATARAATEEAKKTAALKQQQEAAKAAAVATDAMEIPITKAGKKKKDSTKPAKAGPKKPEWQK